MVGSRGGSDQPPDCLRKLEANPQGRRPVQGGDRLPSRALTATPEEKLDMWRQMLTVWPDYDAYHQRTRREITVIVLEREE